MSNSKNFGLDSLGRRFAGLLSAFGARVVAAEPVVTCDYASVADSTLCRFIIRPSAHERVAIEAHRSDGL